MSSFVNASQPIYRTTFSTFLYIVSSKPQSQFSNSYMQMTSRQQTRSSAVAENSRAVRFSLAERYLTHDGTE